ncbi:MAG: hypothetical protein IBJ11_03765 [Phycisphaerales bacterium]|nr:hypothetical protein [Phycisphaerales bacterium]
MRAHTSSVIAKLFPAVLLVGAVAAARPESVGVTSGLVNPTSAESAPGQDGAGRSPGETTAPSNLVFGPGFDMQWSTIDSGGTSSMTDGPSGYFLIGTAGQWDAGASSGGGNVLTHGMWSVIRSRWACLGDANGDGAVGAADLSLVLSLWGLKAGQAGFNEDADLDDNSGIGSNDLSIILANFGGPCVPQP